MNLFVEWSSRRKKRAAPPVSEPAKQDSLDHTGLQATTIPIGTIGTNGTDHDALVADLKTLCGDDGPEREAAGEGWATAGGVDGPDGDALPAWQSWMNRRYTVWRTRGFLQAEARRIVWGE